MILNVQTSNSRPLNTSCRCIFRKSTFQDVSVTDQFKTFILHAWPWRKRESRFTMPCLRVMCTGIGASVEISWSLARTHARRAWFATNDVMPIDLLHGRARQVAARSDRPITAIQGSNVGKPQRHRRLSIATEWSLQSFNDKVFHYEHGYMTYILPSAS